MKSIRKFIALLLVAALFAGFMPAEELGAAMAETIPASLDGAVDSRAFVGLPNAALQMAQGGESRLTRDGWRYVRFPDTGYAAIVGYEGETTDTLSLPDMLGGADVVAVAPGALAALKGVRTVDVPGNVRAIGDHALPRGATVRALSGSPLPRCPTRSSRIPRSIRRR